MGSWFATHSSQLFLYLSLCGPPVVIGILMLLAAGNRDRESARLDREELRSTIVRLFFSLTVVLGLYLASLPKAAPFSSGQRLGLGILLGGVATALAAMFDCCSRLWSGQGARDPVRGFSAASLIVLTYTGLLSALSAAGFLLMAQSPLEMFVGIGTGVLIVGFAHLIPQKVLTTEGETGEAFFELFLAMTVTVVTALPLAALHYGSGAGKSLNLPRFLWLVPLWIAVIPFSMTCLSGILGVLIPRLKTLTRACLIAGLALVEMCVCVPLITKPVLSDVQPMTPVAAGAVCGAILVWLISRRPPIGFQNANRRWLGSVETAALASLIVFIGLFVGFRFLAGYGVALVALSVASMTMSLLPLVAASHKVSVPDARTLRPLTRTVGVLASFALLRALLEISDLTETSLSLYTHFVFFGLMLGCVVPFVIDALRVATTELAHPPKVVTELLVPFMMGVATAVLAPGLFLFWGIKAVAGLFTGLVLCQTMLLFVETSAEGRSPLTRHAVSLISWGTAVPALCVVPLLSPYEDLVTRQHKICVVAALGVLFILWSLAANLMRGRKGEEAP